MGLADKEYNDQCKRIECPIIINLHTIIIQNINRERTKTSLNAIEKTRYSHVKGIQISTQHGSKTYM